MAYTNLGRKLKSIRNIGAGGYGMVSEGIDEYGNHWALKKIQINRDGLPCLMEAALMSVLQHPYIQASTCVHATGKNLYIISELAKHDLSAWTKNNRMKHSPSDEQLRDWAWSIVQAVVCLHKHGIIHGDIKAANCLLFFDNTVKLTDFTLAVQCPSAVSTYSHNVGTCTHRAPEVWMKGTWSYSVDIWALGCTLYEIAYGENLIPYQRNHHDIKDKQDRERERSKAINCIMEYAQCTNQEVPTYVTAVPGTASRSYVNMVKSAVEYIPPSTANHKITRSPLFVDLLTRILRVDPKQRLTIEQIADHPYFQGMEECSYRILSLPGKNISSKVHEQLVRCISNITKSPSVTSLAVSIYNKICATKRYVDSNSNLLVCVYIANKLVFRTPLSIGLSQYQINAIERDICEKLEYRLLDIKDDAS